MAVIEIKVPDIGDFSNVEVIEILAKEGDTITIDQSLATVESDKASMEIPSSASGVIQKMLFKVGDKVSKGSPLLMLEVKEGAAETSEIQTSSIPLEQSAPSVESKANVEQVSAYKESSAVAEKVGTAECMHVVSSVTIGLTYASPSVRKFARELGVSLNEVKGSGNKGRICEEDVKAFSRTVMSGQVQTQKIKENNKSSDAVDSDTALGLLPWPQIDFAKFGPIERVDRSRIKKISAANLHRNWVMIPHVTTHDDADITDLEAFRVQLNKENEKSGIKVTMLAFLMKACIAALKKYPSFNSSLDGDQLVVKHYYHIGFAADTPNGLMVPVIKDADKKGVFQISQELGELAKKARDGKLSPNEMQGATFTISSLGGIGSRYFTPIINAPEVAIMGVCKSQLEPVWDGKGFVPRLKLPLSLSWDHRVIDGALASRFNVYVAQILADFRRVLL